MDDGYFPTRGISGGIKAELVSRMFTPEKGSLFGIVSLDGKMPVAMGRFALIPQGSLRYILGENVPIVYSNVMGGDFAGRYVEQQLPFMGNYMMIGRLDARLGFGKSHYVSAIFNAAYDFDNFGTFELGEHVFGAGLEYAYDSVVGPLKLDIHWNSLTKKVGAYVSLGFNF